MLLKTHTKTYMIIPLLLVACASTAGYMHLDHKIDNTRQDVVVLRKYENETRTRVNDIDTRTQKLEVAVFPVDGEEIFGGK